MAFEDEDDIDFSSMDRGDSLVTNDDTPEGEAEKGEDQDKSDGNDKAEGEAEAEAGASEEEQDAESEGEDDDQPRDDKGRFKKKDDEDGLENGVVRFNKMREQRDAERQAREQLQRELESLRQQQNPKEAAAKIDPVEALNTELDALYTKVEEARAEADTKLAAQLQRQIDTKNREIARIEAERVARTTTSAHDENARFNSTLAKLESEIGALNPEHDDFDPKAVQALEWHLNAYEKAGMKPADALMYAASTVLGYTGKVAAPPVPTPAPAKPKTNVSKAVDTQKKQPPDMSNSGVNKDDIKIDVANMTDEEWAALPEASRKKLRGDAG